MLKQSDALRVLAERYRTMSEMTDDLRARKKFRDYAAVYAALSKRAAGREKPEQCEDEKSVALSREWAALSGKWLTRGSD